MRVCVFGDVHGMLDELKALVAAVGLRPDDVLVSAGDLLDKGPDCAGVVAYLRSIREAGQKVVLVMGNHEERHARYRDVLARTGTAPKMKNVEETARITAELSPEDVAFLDTAVLFHRIPEHGAVVVHAGITPDMTSLPSDEEIAALPKAQSDKLRRVLRVRHVTAAPRVKLTLELDLGDHDVEGIAPNEEIPDQTFDQIVKRVGKAVLVDRKVRPKGSFVSLGQEEPGDPFWADEYDGRFGHVYFGHNPFTKDESPREFLHATGLDLGCVFGGKLASVVLEPGEPRRFVTVPSRGRFATKLWEEV